MEIDLSIKKVVKGKTVTFKPLVEEGITLETDRQGSPGTLKFNVLKDDIINFSEGDIVTLSVDGKDVFLGYVFLKSRNSDSIISVTAYDQLRYLKNKDTKNFQNMTLSEILKEIADDFELEVGVIEDSGYVIKSMLKENTALIDMISSAINTNLKNKNEMFVIYDDYGKICLKNVASMEVDFLLTESVCSDFNYQTDIDSNTYNRVRVYNKEATSEKDKTKQAEDKVNINNWGVLQYFENVEEGEDPQSQANERLELYNKKTRTLSVSNVFGDTRVRAGSTLPVQLNLGDMALNSFLVVDKCKHSFKENEHLMDLTLIGGEF